MPRIRQNAEQDAVKDLVGEINAQRARFGYNTFPELGKVLGVCPKSAWNYLQDPDSIRLGTMRKIVKVLKPDANSENRITCDGVSDSSQLEWKFTDKKNSKADLSIQLKTFCCDRYQNCEVYQMLRQIYEEE